jgi:hypothetical protein
MKKTELTNKLDELNVKYCFNEQEYATDKLKFIIVGDNPGKTEYETNRFFIGKSGQDLRNHFLRNNLISEFDQECMIRNKTFIYTKATNDLETTKNVIGTNIFNSIQENCANEIAEISNKFNLPILIFGKSKIGPNQLFDTFWQLINQKVKHSNILVFSHPAYSRFEQEWNHHANVLTYSSSIDLLKQIGEKNAELINKKYNTIMRKRFFYGAETHNTWPKLFVLTDDGKFYCEYLDYMKPATIQENFDFDTFKAEQYTWSGYQTIVEIDEATAKNKTLKRQSNWIAQYIDNL